MHFSLFKKKFIKNALQRAMGGVVVVPELFLWLDGVPRYVVCTC